MTDLLIESFPLLMFAGTIVILLLGFPVAFSLAGSAVLFASLGAYYEEFDYSFFGALPGRIVGIMKNETLIAIPLFILMGVLLEKSKISEKLLDTMGHSLGRLSGGLGISVCLVGALLAASTGIVGATVVTMGLISLPTMMKHRYHPVLATGIITASGTLGQIIPPSIILIVLGDVMGSAYQQAQLEMGIYSPETITVGDLFIGALVPGGMLVCGYVLYVWGVARFFPQYAVGPTRQSSEDASKLRFRDLLLALAPALLLIICVLGSILFGIATPTEASSIGCVGAILLAALKKQLSFNVLKEALSQATQINAMVFAILIGASLFSLVFRGYEGDEWVHELLSNVPGGVHGAFGFVMLVMFFMGFFLDFFEITFVVVPVVAPALLTMGVDPVWLGVMIALVLQTSFLTPPFGFALFYLRGVAPKEVSTTQIYLGVIPFIFIQLGVLLILWYEPGFLF